MIHRPEQTRTLQWIEIALAIAGLFAPVMVSMLLYAKDKLLLSDLKARLTFRKIPFKAIALILGLTFSSIILAQLLSIPLGYSWKQFHVSGQPTFQSFVFSAWFTLIFAAIAEELAWHSTAPMHFAPALICSLPPCFSPSIGLYGIFHWVS
ncbi:MAG: hypothetical protein ACTTJ9_10115 [Segatella oris]|uniref:hypothetical protein n=1 Tax=Segatella oris TaxID=28135 RepID=UPI003FA31F61